MALRVPDAARRRRANKQGQEGVQNGGHAKPLEPSLVEGLRAAERPGGHSECLTPTRAGCSERGVKLAALVVFAPLGLLSLGCSGGKTEPAVPESSEEKPAPAPAAEAAPADEEEAGPV